jgi:hypothetical protein
MSIHTLELDSQKLNALLGALGITRAEFEMELTKFELDPKGWLEKQLGEHGWVNVWQLGEHGWVNVWSKP